MLQRRVAFYLQTENDKFLATSRGTDLECVIATAVLLAVCPGGVDTNVTAKAERTQRDCFTVHLDSTRLQALARLVN